MIKLLALAVVLPLFAACAAPPPALLTPTCMHRDPAGEKSIGYCQAVRIGNDLYISGVTSSGPMERALPQVYDKLKSILEANGLTFANVVKENVYATDLDAFIKASSERKPYYGANLPAATWVQVQRLFAAALVLEVELIAHFPK